MIEGEIVQDQMFVHVENRHTYMVLCGTSNGIGSIVTRMKTLDGTWVPAIVYYDVGQAGAIFTRAETSFRNRFTRT